MWACCPFLNRLARLSGQLATACLEHNGIALDSSNAKLGFEVPNKRRCLHGTVAAYLIR